MARFAAGVLAAAVLSAGAWAEGTWYKGVTHVHSLWSDGDAAPEVIAQWYKERGYHFMCFSDHFLLQEGEKWYPVGGKSKLQAEHIEGIRTQFGADWVQVREAEGVETAGQEMRLKTHEELSAKFNEAGKFLLVPAEEITTRGGSPHVNGLNLREAIESASRDDVSKLLQQYIDAVHEQRTRLGIPMLAHVNHLNWSDGVTAEEMIAVRGLEFFEVFNGHSGVHSWGIPEKGMPSGDRHWDIIQSIKQMTEPGYVLYGVSTDDSHEYHEWGLGKTNPGRGWIMVRSETLEGGALMNAMLQGDFYASTGVVLKDVQRSKEKLRIEIQAEDGVEYTTQFVGTLRGFDSASEPVKDHQGVLLPRATRKYSDEIGKVLLETKDKSPEYVFTGEELYVRARVVSTKPVENPHEEGDFGMAWVQPVVVGAG